MASHVILEYSALQCYRVVSSGPGLEISKIDVGDD